MNTIKTLFLTAAVIGAACLSSCGSSDNNPPKNYFATTGISAVIFSSVELNEHFNDFEPLYNKRLRPWSKKIKKQARR